MDAKDTTNIAFVIDYLFGINGGTERQLYLLVQGMVSRGYGVTIYVFRHTEFTLNEVEKFPCPVVCLNINSILAIKTAINLLRFRKTIREDRISVIHVFFNDAAILIPLFCGSSRVTIITSRRDMGIGYSKMRLMLLRFANRFVDRIVCNSSAVAALTTDKEVVSPGKISVIYNGISAIDKATQTPPACLSGYDSDAFNMILVANIRPVKRLGDLVLAADHLKKNGMVQSFHVWVVGAVGDLGYYNSVVDVINKSGLSGLFTFTGKLAEPRSLLKYMDLGLLTSESEGFSNTIIEYLDAGLPVVCSNVGGNPEIVRNGVNGFLYESGDWKSLADTISLVALNKVLFDDLSKGASDAAKIFASKNMIDSQEEIYKCSIR